MKINSSGWLSENQLLILRAEENWLLKVQRGTVWLTVPGQIEDVFLSAGTSYQLSGSGRAIIESINGPALILRQRPTRAIRLIRLLAGYASRLAPRTRAIKSPALSA